MTSKKALLVAPFWGQPSHVGVYRVERFARWLSSAGVEVIVVRAGPADATIPGDVEEIVVRDPLHAVAAPQVRRSWFARRVGPLRNVVVNAVSPPDGRLAWARAAARDTRVLERARGADFVISSSPPESAHLCASAIAAAAGARHVVDMRDGWLDEPLKWLLRHSRIQRFREGRMERSVLEAAHRVFVVSDVLREMLVERYPALAPRAAVLTNCGPPAELATTSPHPPRARPRLVYAGRLSGSNARQSADLLLEPLVAAAERGEAPADIVFLGHYEPADTAAIARVRPRLERSGWTLTTRPAVPRAEALREMADADALLLLALGRGILTTKLFEYLATGRPILAVTVRDGALWRLASRSDAPIPQVFLVDAGARGAQAVPALLAAAREARTWQPPEELSEAALRRVFLAELGLSDDRLPT